MQIIILKVATSIILPNRSKISAVEHIKEDACIHYQVYKITIFVRAL